MNRLIWLGCLAYLVIGAAHVVSGAILEPMIVWYGLDYRQAGQFIMNQFLGFLGGVLLAPFLSRKLGKRKAILLGLGALTAAEAAYSAFLSWGWMLSVAPVAGFGFGMTEAIIGAMIITAVKEKAAAAMTKVELFFGVGAFIMPLIAAFLIREGAWQLAFPVLTVFVAAVTLLWIVMGKRLGREMEYAEPPSSDAQVARRGYRGASLLILALGMLYFLIYVGMEMSFSNYLPSIMIGRTGMQEATAAATISIFWGAILVGRLFAGRWAERSGYARYLVTVTAAGMIVLMAIGFVGHSGLSLVLIAVNGLLWAGVFAVALVYINQLLPGHTERTTSLLVACGGLGGALMPKLTGWMMDCHPVQWTLAMIAGASVIMLLLMLVIAVMARRLLRGREQST